MNQKSPRRQKLNQETALQKPASLSSIKSAEEIAPSTEDWLPPKTLLKPEGQLVLTAAEMEEEITRILNANNPHAPQNISRFNNKEGVFKTVANMEHASIHFSQDGYWVYNAQEDNIEEIGEVRPEIKEEEKPKNEQEQPKEIDGEEPTEADKKKGVLRNQFNYSERAAQTVNNPYRERYTNTEPPPHRNFSDTVNQWSIFDAYSADSENKKNKQQKEKSKPSGKKGNDDSSTLLPKDSHTEELYYKNSELRQALLITERMANQNTFDDVAHDYKYWLDASDELGDKKSGSLLPLWSFTYQKQKKKMVTALAPSHQFTDLFAVGYGSFDFSAQGPGILVLFSLKNPSCPEYIFPIERGVMSVDIHPVHSSMIAVGLYDGSMRVYDISVKSTEPVYVSDSRGNHAEPVWQVRWQKDDLDDNMVLMSISTDGRICQWTLLKNAMVHSDVLTLQLDGELSSGCSFDFPKDNDQLFVVGTEEGDIFKCSKEYSSEWLFRYGGHSMGVYAVRYNPFDGNYFISCSADWTVKLWHANEVEPIITFDLNSSVGDVAWAPYSSTVFAAVTAEGKVFVYDLSVNKYSPMCEQPVVKKSKLTMVRFNPFDPMLLVGDDNGLVQSFKLSPNLCKKPQSKEEEIDKLTTVVKAAKGISNL